MSADIIPFPDVMEYSGPVAPIRVLKGAMDADLETILVIGVDQDGGQYVASSTRNLRDLLWMLEKAKHTMLNSSPG